MPEEFTPPQQTPPYGVPVPSPAPGYPPADGHPHPGHPYAGQAQPGYAQPGNAQPGYAPSGYAPAGYAPPPMVPFGQYPAPSGPVGKIRPTGIAILLCVVTLGIYPLYYYFATHDEMKRHTGQGLGGGIALVLAIFVGIASPFLLSHEVGELYQRAGRARPVSALTGLWVALGWMIIVGPIVWFVKTNGALNAYWRSVGARRPRTGAPGSVG